VSALGQERRPLQGPKAQQEPSNLSYIDCPRRQNPGPVFMADNTSKSELRSTWESAAPGWAKWEQAFSAGLSGATDTLIDMAGVRAGVGVLDLACGAGSQSIQAAKRVGPSGSVVASDISATMLDHVRRNAGRGRSAER